MMKKYLKIATLFGFSMQLYGLKHGESCYIKVQGQEKYLTAGVEGFRFDPNSYQYLTSDVVFADTPQAASRWIVRIVAGAPGQDIGVGQTSNCMLQNAFTGGQLTCWLDNLWQPNGTKSYDNASFICFSAGFSRLDPFPNQIAWNNSALLVQVSGNTFTLALPPIAPPSQGQRPSMPIGYRQDLNSIRAGTQTTFELVGITESPTVNDTAARITQGLQYRGFKTLKGRGFRTFAFIDGSKQLHIFALRCPNLGEGYSGTLYKYSEDAQLFQAVAQCSPYLNKGGDSWFPKEFSVSDLDMFEDGRIMASGGFNGGGLSGGRFKYFTPQIGLFLPVQTTLQELAFSRPANYGQWGAGAGSFGKQFYLLPQNNPYKFFTDAGTNPNDIGLGIKFDGSADSQPAYATYTPSNFTDPSSGLSPEAQVASKLYRDVKYGPGNFLYALQVAPPAAKQIIMHDGKFWNFLPTPIIPVRIATDSNHNPYILSADSQLYVYQNNTWSQIQWNAPAIFTNNDPVKRFSVAGTPSALKIIAVSNSGECAAATNGSSAGITLKNFSLTSAAGGADLKINGVLDAGVAADGTVVLCVRDNDQDENGQVWQGSIMTALNDAFAAAEVTALAAASNA